MFFLQFKVEGLGCYSYLIGCPKAGVACVVDPERHVEHYLDVAQEDAMRITDVFDTHLHADHIASSYPKFLGYDHVFSLIGGMTAWNAASRNP